MNFDSWKSVLAIAVVFFISTAFFMFYSGSPGSGASALLISAFTYYGVTVLKAALTALLAFFLSGRRLSLPLTLSLVLFTLFVSQIVADILMLAMK